MSVTYLTLTTYHTVNPSSLRIPSLKKSLSTDCVYSVLGARHHHGQSICAIQQTPPQPQTHIYLPWPSWERQQHAKFQFLIYQLSFFKFDVPYIFEVLDPFQLLTIWPVADQLTLLMKILLISSIKTFNIHCHRTHPSYQIFIESLARHFSSRNHCSIQTPLPPKSLPQNYLHTAHTFCIYTIYISPTQTCCIYLIFLKKKNRCSL